MKAVPLLLLALVFVAPLRAQSPLASDHASLDVEQGRLLAEIDSWSGVLAAPGVPGEAVLRSGAALAELRSRVKGLPSETGLAEARKDLDAWKKDFEDSRNAAAARPRPAFAEGRDAEALFDGTARHGALSVDVVKAGALGTPSGPAPVETAALGLHINPAPAPAAAPQATTEALSWDSLTGFFDLERGLRVARDIVERAKGYAKRCYAHVKQALIDAGILDVPDRTQTRIAGFRPDMAKMFAEDANRNPEVLAKLGYRRVDIKTITGDDPRIIPNGTILNYAAGCAGFSRTAGHIELTTSREMIQDMPAATRAHVASRLTDDQVLACSDGCSGRTLDFIRTYGRLGCLNMYVPVRPTDAPPQG